MHPLHLVLALLVTMVWGFNFAVLSVGLEGFSPLFLCFLRLFLTSIPAVFFIKRPAAPFYKVAIYGLAMFAIQFSLAFSAIYAGLPPGLASLLIQIQVVFTILIAVTAFGEKIHQWQIIGSVVSIAGIAIVALQIGGEVTLAGMLLIIGAAAASGTGNIVSKHIGKVNIVSLVVWGSLISWPILLLFSFMMEGIDDMIETYKYLTWSAAGAVFYITYLSTLFGYAAWAWLLYRYPLSTMAPFSLLVPVFGLISSVWLLGESLFAWKITAGLLVITGLCVNMAGTRLQAAMKREIA